YETTQDLVQIIDDNKPAKWKEKIHPATRVFQALRIAVNDELGVLERVIPQAMDLLNPGGRLAIISFHSLEDRIVKHAFKAAAEDCICPPSQPVCTCDKEAEIKIITRKPVTPTDNEIAQNPRSRSAKLRVAEKL
ncbi:MAG: 16S rRNA (cytosine(1402)-N(4))-methyltransferase RsmH, partial [Chloroflexota bacterium]